MYTDHGSAVTFGIVPEALIVSAIEHFAALLQSRKHRFGRDFTLASGDLGYVLVADLVRQVSGEQQYAQTAEQLLARAWEVGVRSQSFGLYSGIGGLAWTIGAYPHLATNSMTQWTHRLMKLVVERCESGGINAWQHFDLIEGVAGLLVSSDACRDLPTSQKLAQTLCKFFRLTNEGVALYTPTTKVPVETGATADTLVENFGMGHGLTGVVAALQNARRNPSASCVVELANAATTRLSNTFARHTRRSFPSYFLNGEEVASKHAAWCYGILPVAKVLLNSMDAASIYDGIATWKDPLSVETLETRLASHGKGTLCHGAAGLAYTLGLLALQLRCASLWSNAIEALWFGSALLSDRRTTAFVGDGLLTGSLGCTAVCLALAVGSSAPLGQLLGLHAADR